MVSYHWRNWTVGFWNQVQSQSTPARWSAVTRSGLNELRVRIRISLKKNWPHISLFDQSNDTSNCVLSIFSHTCLSCQSRYSLMKILTALHDEETFPDPGAMYKLEVKNWVIQYGKQEFAFQDLTAASMKMAWLRESSPWWWRQQAPLKRWVNCYQTTRRYNPEDSHPQELV
jgi:hypothetical protein